MFKINREGVDKLIKLICLLFAETRRPLVKVLLKNDACTLLLHNLRAVADDRGLGHDISLQIHQILAAIGHHGLFLKNSFLFRKSFIRFRQTFSIKSSFI